MPRDTSQSGRTGGSTSGGTTWTNGVQTGSGGGGGGSPYMNNGMFSGRYEGNFGPARQLGLTTGSTIYGNTAFGPAGGRAVGYAMSNGGNSMGPGNANYSDFRTPSGATAFGNVGGMQFNAPNARAGAMYAAAMNRAMQQPSPQAVPAGVPGQMPTKMQGRVPVDPYFVQSPFSTAIPSPYGPRVGPVPAMGRVLQASPYNLKYNMGGYVGGAGMKGMPTAASGVFDSTGLSSGSWYNNPALGTPGPSGLSGGYNTNGPGGNYGGYGR